MKFGRFAVVALLTMALVLGLGGSSASAGHCGPVVSCGYTYCGPVSYCAPVTYTYCAPVVYTSHCYYPVSYSCGWSSCCW